MQSCQQDQLSRGSNGKLIFHGTKVQGDFELSFPPGFRKSRAGNRAAQIRCQVVYTVHCMGFPLFCIPLLTLQWENLLSFNFPTPSLCMTNNAGFSLTNRIIVDDRNERLLPGIFIRREISREALLHPHPIPVSIPLWLVQHPYNPVQENGWVHAPKAL